MTNSTDLISRPLGHSGIEVSAVGLGCNNFGRRVDLDGTRAVVDAALEHGITFIDTADIYGRGQSEEYLGEVLQGRREQVVLATKFGIVRDPENPSARGVNGRPDYVHASCDASLRRLAVEHIDLYYQHRVDPDVPIEETVGAMAELVDAGKVRFLGLSEAGPETIRRAHAVHPISALQTEYSLWSRDPEDEILTTVRELGIGFVAYSPLGRGFLTGQITSPEDFEAGDFRRQNPRFQGDNFARNLELVERVREIAADKDCTPGQLALAWVMAQGDDIVPIPGTKRRSYLEQNVEATEISLSDSELAAIDEAAPRGAASGDRYPDMSGVGR